MINVVKSPSPPFHIGSIWRLPRLWVFEYCGKNIVAKYYGKILWHKYCDKDIVAKILWQKYSVKNIVAKILWQKYCDKNILANIFWQKYCGKSGYGSSLILALAAFDASPAFEFANIVAKILCQKVKMVHPFIMALPWQYLTPPPPLRIHVIRGSSSRAHLWKQCAQYLPIQSFSQTFVQNNPVLKYLRGENNMISDNCVKQYCFQPIFVCSNVRHTFTLFFSNNLISWVFSTTA